MTILCLSPHTDDCELSAGATMAKLTKAGHQVVNVAFSDCDNEALSTEFRRSSNILATSCKMLGHERRQFPLNRQYILTELIQLREIFKPTVVFTPSPHQRHQDHQVIHEETRRAFNCSIYGYEQPWNSTFQNLTAFSEVSKADLNNKLDALHQYTSQVERRYFNQEFICSWARLRGVQFNVELAEAFEVIQTRIEL